MKVVIVGGTGLIGSAVAKQLKDRHEVIVVGHRGGDYQVDILSEESIKDLFEKIGPFDALVSATGQTSGRFRPLVDMRPQDYYDAINSKLMGQVSLVLAALPHINDGGSCTLISGILNDDPIPMGSSAALANGALESWVYAAAFEMPRSIRINIVSPTVITEAMDKYAPYFRGYEPVPVSKVALAYEKSIEGVQTGQIFRVGY